MFVSKVTLAVVVASALFTAATGVMASGNNAPTKRFTISGGQTVELPITDQGPLPASAEGVKVEVAGPLFGPSKTTPGKLALIWAFSLSVPPDSKYKSVSVENVSEQAAEAVLNQTSPKAQQLRAPDGKEFNILQLRGSAKDISQESTPWIFQDGHSTIIFRITLENESGKILTLYQATQFAESQKSPIRQMASRTANSK